MSKRVSKWLVPLVLSLALVFTVTGCGKNNNNAGNTGNGGTNGGTNVGDNAGNAGDDNSASKISIGMVTDVGGVNDNSFNQSAWEGLQQFNKSTGAKVDYLQSTGDADYEPNLNQFVRGKYDLTWGIGFMMGDAMKKVADENPNAKLAIIDAAVEAPNVASVLFKEHEGSFLVGVVAGLMTKSNKIGFIGGGDIPVIHRFEAGFIAGVKAANPDAKVTVNYTGVFNAPDQGKAAAATIYNGGADIIFHASGETGNGVFNEATELRKAGKNVWVIGVDQDQSKIFGTEVTLTSMIKRVDHAVQVVAQDVIDGKFPGGTIVNLGLKEEGVGLPAENPNVPQDVLDKVKDYAQQIIDGKITVPEER